MSLVSDLRVGLRYALAGALNTIVGFATVLVAEHMFGLAPFEANACGFAVGIVVGFVVNRSWAFRHTGSSGRSAILYVVAFGICYCFNLFVLWLALHVLGWPSFVAQGLAVAVYSVAFFLACRFVVFANDLAS